MVDTSKMCLAMGVGGWSCSLPRGHGGDQHVAYYFHSVRGPEVDRWLIIPKPMTVPDSTGCCVEAKAETPLAPPPIIQPLIGLGGAPTRATTLSGSAQERKECPVASGFTDYFPDAIVAVAQVSFLGNQQHNPGQPVHWARGKSTDEADAIMRHFLQRGLLDSDGVRHSAKMAWRAMALLQKEIEMEK